MFIINVIEQLTELERYAETKIPIADMKLDYSKNTKRSVSSV